MSHLRRLIYWKRASYASTHLSSAFNRILPFSWGFNSLGLALDNSGETQLEKLCWYILLVLLFWNLERKLPAVFSNVSKALKCLKDATIVNKLMLLCEPTKMSPGLHRKKLKIVFFALNCFWQSHCLRLRSMVRRDQIPRVPTPISAQSLFWPLVTIYLLSFGLGLAFWAPCTLVPSYSNLFTQLIRVEKCSLSNCGGNMFWSFIWMKWHFEITCSKYAGLNVSPIRNPQKTKTFPGCTTLQWWTSHVSGDVMNWVPQKLDCSLISIDSLGGLQSDMCSSGFIQAALPSNKLTLTLPTAGWLPDYSYPPLG